MGETSFNKKFKQETRPCGACKHFFKIISGYKGCSKKLMAVTESLKVFYPRKDGTCFENPSLPEEKKERDL